MFNKNMSNLDQAINELLTNCVCKYEDIRIINKAELIVIGWNKGDIKLLTKLTAKIELDEIISKFNKMIEDSILLKDIIKSKPILFSLAHHYGMGGVEICHIKNGNLTWVMELP